LEVLWGGGFDTGARLRGWFRFVEYRRRGRRKRVRFIFKLLVWPLASVNPMLRLVRQIGPSVKAAEKVGLTRQFLQAWWLCFRIGIEPKMYYRFRWYRAERRKRASAYLWNFMLYRLHLRVTAAVAPDEASMLDNKDRFGDWCRSHNLPAPRIISVFESGEEVGAEIEHDEEYPPGDLFSKPAASREGLGAMMWSAVGNGTYLDADGSAYTQSQLKSFLKAQSLESLQGRRAGSLQNSQENRILLQARLQNHPDLSDLSNRALCTARIVTARDDTGMPRLLLAAFRMSVGDSVVDNFHRGGFLSAVHLETGKLLSGMWGDVERCVARIDTHPETSAKVAGRQLPHWAEAARLVLRAHGLLESIPSVGWDVAFTGEGPVLIEANVIWHPDVMQVASDSPIADTFYGNVLLHHLRVLGRN
jgi:hypothetical protein